MSVWILLQITIGTYIAMTVYSAAIGWTIGAGIEKDCGDLPAPQKANMAATSAAYMINQSKYILMIAPSLFVSWLVVPDQPVLFMYAYSSTMLLHLAIVKVIRLIKKSRK